MEKVYKISECVVENLYNIAGSIQDNFKIGSGCHLIEVDQICHDMDDCFVVTLRNSNRYIHEMESGIVEFGSVIQRWFVKEQSTAFKLAFDLSKSKLTLD